jgi:hypothetical protein
MRSGGCFSPMTVCHFRQQPDPTQRRRWGGEKADGQERSSSGAVRDLIAHRPLERRVCPHLLHGLRLGGLRRRHEPVVRVSAKRAQLINFSRVRPLSSPSSSPTTGGAHKLYGHPVIYPIHRSGCPCLPLPPNRAVRLPFTTGASPNARYSAAWCRITSPPGWRRTTTAVAAMPRH